MGCSSLLSVAMINTMATSNLERKRFISLTLPGHKPSCREAKLQAGAWRRNHRKKDAYWLALKIPFSYLSCIDRTHLPRNDTTHSQLCSSISISNLENASKNAHMPIWWRQFLSWVSLLRCLKMTAKTSCHMCQSSSALSHKHTFELYQIRVEKTIKVY